MSAASGFEAVFRRLYPQLVASPPIEAEVPSRAAKTLPIDLVGILTFCGRSGLVRDHNRLLQPGEMTMDDAEVITFAVEREHVVSWGFAAAERHENPPVLVRDSRATLPWTEDGRRLDEFLMAFAYWNAANGVAPVTAVGEVGSTTRDSLGRFEQEFSTVDFVVHRRGDVFVLTTPDSDLYVFGKQRSAVDIVVRELLPAWLDYEG